MKGFIRFNLLIVLLIGNAISTANATLIDATVTCDVEPAILWSCSTPTATVSDPGVEFQVSIDGDTVNFDIDLAASSISMTNIGPNSLDAGAGELLTLGALNWTNGPGRIIGIDNFFTSGTTFIDPTDITFTDNSVTIDFNQGAFWTLNSVLSFDLVVQHTVPAPATLALSALGLAGLAVSRRKKRA